MLHEKVDQYLAHLIYMFAVLLVGGYIEESAGTNNGATFLGVKHLPLLFAGIVSPPFLLLMKLVCSHKINFVAHDTSHLVLFHDAYTMLRHSTIYLLNDNRAYTVIIEQLRLL